MKHFSLLITSCFFVFFLGAAEQKKYTVKDLVKAAASPNSDQLKKILESDQEIDVNAFAQDEDDELTFGFNPLIMAAFAESDENIKYLLSNKEKLLLKLDLKATEHDGDTALMLAARNGNVGIVGELLQAGAKINVKNDAGDTVLADVIKEEKEDVLERLLEEKGLSEIEKAEALLLAVKEDLDDMVEILLKAKVKTNARDEFEKTSLIISVEQENEDIIETLLKVGADKEAQDQNGYTALMVAAKKGNAEILKLLIDAKANLNATKKGGNSALINAAENDDVDILKQLIAAGADRDKKNDFGYTALMIAAEKDNKKSVQVLLNAQAKKDLTNLLGYTALMLAAKEGAADSIKLLLDSGVDTQIKAITGTAFDFYKEYLEQNNKKDDELLNKLKPKTVPQPVAQKKYTQKELLAAIRDDDVQILKNIIVSKTLNFNAKNIMGMTPLMLAVNGSKKDVVELLIQNKSNLNLNVDAKDTDGYTALMLAATTGNTEIIDMLVQAGADINLKSRDDATALSIYQGTITGSPTQAQQKILQLLKPTPSLTQQKPAKKKVEQEQKQQQAKLGAQVDISSLAKQLTDLQNDLAGLEKQLKK